jgi:hypothetical protein
MKSSFPVAGAAHLRDIATVIGCRRIGQSFADQFTVVPRSQANFEIISTFASSISTELDDAKQRNIHFGIECPPAVLLSDDEQPFYL